MRETNLRHSSKIAWRSTMRKQYQALIGVVVALLLLAGCGEEKISEEEIETEVRIYAGYLDYWACVLDGECSFDAISYEVEVFNTSDREAALIKLKIWLYAKASPIGSFTLTFANVLPRERRVQKGKISLGGVFYNWEEFAYKEEFLLIE
jgi:hypothetical protein